MFTLVSLTGSAFQNTLPCQKLAANPSLFPRFLWIFFSYLYLLQSEITIKAKRNIIWILAIILITYTNIHQWGCIASMERPTTYTSHQHTWLVTLTPQKLKGGFCWNFVEIKTNTRERHSLIFRKIIYSENLLGKNFSAFS